MTFLPLFSIPDALGTSGLGFLLVLAVLAVIMLFVRLLSKILGGKSKKENKEETVTEAQSPAPVQSTQTGTVIAEEPAKAEIGKKAKSDEDVLSYIAFPTQAESFFDYRDEMASKTYSYEIKAID